MTRDLRAAGKILILTLWSMLFLLPGAAALLRRDRLRRSAKLTRCWARGALLILGGKVEVSGMEPLRAGGLIVSNHLGYLDIMVHAATFETRFAPKIEMRRWPLFGALTALSNPVWIDRRHRGRAGKTEEIMRAALGQEVPLLVYPEGTSGDGNGMMPFKTTCFSAAIGENSEILPVLTSYDVPADGTVLPWFGRAALLPHIWRVMGLKEFRCHVYIMKAFRPEVADRRILAATLHDAMEETYRKRLGEAKEDAAR